MDRINQILNDSQFMEYLKKNEQSEEMRIFCRHDLVHFLDVCRIALILNLERNLGLDKEIIYAAGLLHDIGRWVEYATGQDHASASAELAKAILERCGFSKGETAAILDAISAHRSKAHESELSRILFEADKASRMCLTCPARSQCKNFRHGETFLLKY